MFAIVTMSNNKNTSGTSEKSENNIQKTAFEAARHAVNNYTDAILETGNNVNHFVQGFFTNAEKNVNAAGAGYFEAGRKFAKTLAEKQVSAGLSDSVVSPTLDSYLKQTELAEKLFTVYTASVFRQTEILNSIYNPFSPLYTDLLQTGKKTVNEILQRAEARTYANTEVLSKLNETVTQTFQSVTDAVQSGIASGKTGAAASRAKE